MDEIQAWVEEHIAHGGIIMIAPRHSVEVDTFCLLFEDALRDVVGGAPAFDTLMAADGDSKGYGRFFERLHDEGRI